MPNDKSEILNATLDAEEALIGAILIESTCGNREAINKVSTNLEANHFWHEDNQAIFKAMVNCPLPPHQVNLARQMHSDNTLTNGILSHLCHCVSVCPCSLDYMDYANAVKRYSAIRTGKKLSPHIKGAL